MDVIFLDIDGVLNSEQWFGLMIETDQLEEHATMVDPKAVKKITDLCDEFGLSIVVSSSWRSWNVKETIDEFKKNKNLRPITKYIVGVTPGSIQRRRGDEIQRYMFLTKVDRYVIFDDDTDMLEEQQKNFIHTNYYYGVTDEDIEKAKEILKKQEASDK
jgi:hypothetical protein